MLVYYIDENILIGFGEYKVGIILDVLVINKYVRE